MYVPLTSTVFDAAVAREPEVARAGDLEEKRAFLGEDAREPAELHLEIDVAHVREVRARAESTSVRPACGEYRI